MEKEVEMNYCTKEELESQLKSGVDVSDIDDMYEVAAIVDCAASLSQCYKDLQQGKPCYAQRVIEGTASKDEILSMNPVMGLRCNRFFLRGAEEKLMRKYVDDDTKIKAYFDWVDKARSEAADKK